ncbi:MAG: FeoA family protein [Candidatus Bathyarchaeia archaeon]|jgi:Fe2+ transport system protein FeoA
MQLPLTLLKNGETGIITTTDLPPEEDEHMCRHRARWGRGHRDMAELCVKRLSDLGLTPGTDVTVVKSAPFKGPIEVLVRGSRLVIGRGMASNILVEVKR